MIIHKITYRIRISIANAPEHVDNQLGSVSKQTSKEELGHTISSFVPRCKRWIP